MEKKQSIGKITFAVRGTMSRYHLNLVCLEIYWKIK